MEYEWRNNWFILYCLWNFYDFIYSSVLSILDIMFQNEKRFVKEKVS